MPHSQPHASSPSAPHVLADHPALDLLNTGGLDHAGVAYDHWRSDADVLAWLARVGLLPETPQGPGSLQGMVESARDLRETVRTLVEKRKAHAPADPARLNHYLRQGVSHAALSWDADGHAALTRRHIAHNAQQALAPLAESAAGLLAGGDFDLVRQCEHPECVLWFYDRTKSHRRRWCSMAICGNRHKVAEFRKRRQAG